MLTVFVIGDVLGAGIYALVGEVGRRGRRRDLDGVPARRRARAVHRRRLRRARDEVPAGRGRRALRATRRSAAVLHVPGRVRGHVLGRHVGGDARDRVRRRLPVGVRRRCRRSSSALVFLAVISLINFRGIKESVELNLGLTAIELDRAAARRRDRARRSSLDGGGDPGRALEFKAGEAVPLAILAGASLAFFALIGFEDSVNVAEETQRPVAASSRARCSSGSGSRGVVYMLVTVIASMAVPTERPRGLRRAAARGRRARARSPCRPKVFAAIALFALTNGALINLIMASRLVYGMAQRGDRAARAGARAPRAPHAVGGDHLHRALAGAARRRRRPRDARRHHRAAAAVRVRVRQRRRARAAARAGRARALPRADGRCRCSACSPASR